MLNSRTTPAIDRSLIAAFLGLILMLGVLAFIEPTNLILLVLGVIILTGIAMRPVWGVGAILAMLLVQYGAPYRREGAAALVALLPGGAGLLTVNNALGVFLAVLLVYRIYRTGDWSFLRIRPVQLLLVLTAALILSSLINPTDYEKLAEYGLPLPGQPAVRQIVSRALFVVLIVSFVRTPRDIRFLVSIFLVLTLTTALSVTADVLAGGTPWKERVPTYRAGGVQALIGAAVNPNRLALVCTLALAFIWEYAQSYGPRWRSWVTTPAILLLVLTVFLSASRGGVVGLSFTALLLLARGQVRGRRILFGVATVLLAGTLVTEIVPAPNWERLSDLPGLSHETSGGGGSVRRRQYTFSLALRIAQQSPLFGVGLGNWEVRRFETDPLRSVASAHNSYLHALVEGGIIALALYLMLFRSTIQQLGMLLRSPEVVLQAQRDGVDWVLTATRYCVLAFLVFSFFANLWELVFLYLLVALASVLIHIYWPILQYSERTLPEMRIAA